MAHRVCAIPACESNTLVRSGFAWSMSSLSLATLPTSLNAKTSFFLSPSTARPAESYPPVLQSALLYYLTKGVRTIFKSCQPIDQSFEDVLSVLFHQVVDVAKDATAGEDY